MKTNKLVAGFEAMLIAPLSVLKCVRVLLRYSSLAHLFVAEEGYLHQGDFSATSGIHPFRGGMKQRVLRLIWQPDTQELLTA